MASFFIGNLSWDTTSANLEDLFGEEFAIASATVQRHEDSDRSKGWALVTLSKAEDGDDFVKTFNETQCDGRQIVVRADRGATVRTNNTKPRRERRPRREQDSKAEEAPAAPSTKLFVGNLSWDTTSKQLDEVFAEAGDVVSAEVMLRQDGRSRGWGIVEMSTIEDAEAAMKDLDQYVMDGRNLKVEFQKPRAPRAARNNTRQKRERRVYDDVEEVPSANIYVGNLPWTVDNDELAGLFADFDVVDADVKSGFDGRSRGYGIVSFGSQDDAAAAIKALNNTDCGGRNIVCRYDRGGVKA